MATLPLTSFSVNDYTPEEQYVIYGCLVAVLDDIHAIVFNFNESQDALSEELVERFTASGQSVLELVMRAHVDGIEDLVDFEDDQYGVLEDFKRDLQEKVDTA